MQQQQLHTSNSSSTLLPKCLVKPSLEIYATMPSRSHSFILALPLSNRSCLLLGLKVVEEDGPLLALLAPVADHDTRAVDDFAGVAFAIEHA